MIINDVKEISLKEFKKLKGEYFDLVSNEDFLVDYIDGRMIQTEQQCYNYFKVKYDFAKYFGNNWDAFADCLMDLIFWDDKQGFIIVIYNFNDMFVHHLDDKRIMIDCLRHVAHFLDTECLTTSGGYNHLKSFDVYLINENIDL